MFISHLGSRRDFQRDEITRPIVWSPKRFAVNSPKPQSPSKCVFVRMSDVFFLPGSCFPSHCHYADIINPIEAAIGCHSNTVKTKDSIKKFASYSPCQSFPTNGG